jgi:flagellar basal-body rod modification protein FlgD
MSIAASGTVPISQLTSQPNPADQMPGTQSSSSGSQLSPNSFLQLLTTEMMNQDPTQPQDPTQSVTQLAQFSALQYQQQLTSAFQGFQSNFSVLQASSLIGKQATVQVSSNSASGGSSTETGTINTIEVQNGQPYFTMLQSNGQPYVDGNGNPLLFSLSQIVGLGSGSGGSTPSGNPPSGGSGGSGS